MPAGYHITILATGGAGDTPVDADSGTSVETTVIAFSATDTGSSVESTVIGGDAAQSSSDSASATENPIVIMYDGDTGTSSETATVGIAVVDIDTGSGVDLGVFPPQFVFGTEDGTGTETNSSVAVPQTILPAGYLSKKWYVRDEDFTNKWNATVQKRWRSRLVTNVDQIS